MILKSERPFAELAMLQIFGWPSLANLILWSLFAEVQFYALLPILFLLFTKRRMAALSILIIAALAYIDYPSRGFGIWKYFFFGILASEISEKLASFRVLNVVLFSTGAALLVVDFLGPEWDYVAKAGLPSGYSNQTLTLGVGCALILATLPHLSLMGRALSIAPFKMMGVTSYSVFIIHPFFMMASFPAIGNLVAAAADPPRVHRVRLARDQPRRAARRDRGLPGRRPRARHAPQGAPPQSHDAQGEPHRRGPHLLRLLCSHRR